MRNRTHLTIVPDYRVEEMRETDGRRKPVSDHEQRRAQRAETLRRREVRKGKTAA